MIGILSESGCSYVILEASHITLQCHHHPLLGTLGCRLGDSSRTTCSPGHGARGTGHGHGHGHTSIFRNIEKVDGKCWGGRKTCTRFDAAGGQNIICQAQMFRVLVNGPTFSFILHNHSFSYYYYYYYHFFIFFLF